MTRASLSCHCRWPFFLGFGVVGYAMAMISIPTGECLRLERSTFTRQFELRTKLVPGLAEEDLKKSTITPHEDKAMASTA